MQQFRDLTFGDYSGLREYKRDPRFFVNSFIQPPSFSLDSLHNRRNFIIVGRKGSGKSSCCLALAHKKNDEGFQSTFYNFSEDLTRAEIKDAVVTQKLNLSDISTKKLFDSIADFYDFRDLWIRRVIHSLSSLLVKQGIESSFVRLSQSMQISDESLAEGVGRGLMIPFPTTDLPRAITDLLRAKKREGALPLRDYNKICLRLLAENHSDLKHYFFFDELNLSHANSMSDQYNTLLALIRDIVRSAAYLNDFFVENGVDISVICCLRPEIRARLLDEDHELSKIIDSNSVDLSWPSHVSQQNPLVQMLKKKIIIGGAEASEIDFIVPEFVKDMDGPNDIVFEMFFLNLTWYRPRDVIRVLKCYQSVCGDRAALFGKGYDQLRFLKEYSRVSSRDCFAELEVKYSSQTLERLKNLMRHARYEDLESLKSDLDPLKNNADLDDLIQDLFDAGVIANHQRDGNSYQIYASYRGDAHLEPNIRILIHRGLWMDMQLRV